MDTGSRTEATAYEVWRSPVTDPDETEFWCRATDRADARRTAALLTTEADRRALAVTFVPVEVTTTHEILRSP